MIGVLSAFWLTPGQWGAQLASVTVGLTFTPSNASGVSQSTRSYGTKKIPCNFPLYFQGLQTVNPGSKTQLTLGNVSPLGFCVLLNTDNVNYVSIYSDAFGASELMRMYPGDPAIFPLGPSSTLYAEPNTNSVAIELYTTSR